MVEATVAGQTDIHRASVAIVAVHSFGGALAIGAGALLRCAGAAIVAVARLGGREAAQLGVAAVGGAGVAVVAEQRRVHAALGAIAAVIGAGVAVVATLEQRHGAGASGDTGQVPPGVRSQHQQLLDAALQGPAADGKTTVRQAGQPAGAQPRGAAHL